MIVGDGNFKTDHVKQKKDDDPWLLDGGGMVPNKEEYANFLKTALELPTVSIYDLCLGPSTGPIVGPVYISAPSFGPDTSSDPEIGAV